MLGAFFTRKSMTESILVAGSGHSGFGGIDKTSMHRHNQRRSDKVRDTDKCIQCIEREHHGKAAEDIEPLQGEYGARSRRDLA